MTSHRPKSKFSFANKIMCPQNSNSLIYCNAQDYLYKASFKSLSKAEIILSLSHPTQICYQPLTRT